jgi:XTP/dITP diphosphohydrolase
MSGLVLATGNAHKVEEYQDLFPMLPIRPVSDFPGMDEPVEDAPDFEGNAIIKAKAALAHTGRVSVADDSGLAVDALGGAPGVISARYVPGTDADRMHAVLQNMPADGDRAAHFVCVIAIAGLPADLELPEGVFYRDGCILARGAVHGAIIDAPRGTNGFGYDPIFGMPDGRTLAEYSAAEKHAVSHRGNAARHIAPFLDMLVKTRPALFERSAAQ